MNSKDILEARKNCFLVEMIRGKEQSEEWLQGASVMDSFYEKKVALGQWEADKFYLCRWST